MYVERFVRRARHVEVQVLGDGRDVVHLFERECSLQRRRQKVVEEAGSPGISAATRAAMTEAAVAPGPGGRLHAEPAPSSSSSTT